MDRRAYGQFKGIFLRTLKKMDTNNQCLYPGCKEKPIDSHIIAESVLKRIAQNGKVLTWNWYEEDIANSDPNDQDWESIYAEPKEAGIVKDVTYPIFCHTHDNDIFRVLENPGFDSQIEQVVLLAYRVLCYKTWHPHLKERLEFLLSFTEPQALVEQERLFDMIPMLKARERLEQMLKTRDYTQLEYRIIALNIPPCIACTDAFIPTDEDEHIRMFKGTLSFTAEDVLTFTFFPERDPNKSTCVITWFRGSQRATHFREFHELDQLSGQELLDMLLTNAFTYNIFISPTWWKSLSQAEKQQAKELQLANARALTNF
jgi:hypothetical protein